MRSIVFTVLTTFQAISSLLIAILAFRFRLQKQVVSKGSKWLADLDAGQSPTRALLVYLRILEGSLAVH
jgi:hypothetical protein